MTDEPVNVIEEYLTLVNEHLPESISEDVITELRTYMVETARDIGEGEITLQSAKKVVAQFGAPSEVAEEYKYSMLPETIPPKGMESPDEKHESKQESDILLQEDETKSRKDPTSSPSEVFLQGVSIAIAWSFLIVLASTLVGPIWLYLDSIITFLIQFTLVAIGLGALCYHHKKRKTLLWKRTYPEWSIIHRFLTLPENVVKEPSDILIALDILGSLSGVVLFLISSLFSPSPYYIPIIVIPASVALLAKAYYCGKRISSLNPTGDIKKEVSATFVALLLIDSSLIWWGWYYRSWFFGLSSVFLIYATIWGAVLLFQLIVQAGDLWWDSSDSEPVVPIRDTETLVQRTNAFAGSIILRLIGWIAFFTIIPTYCLMSAQTIYTPWFAAMAVAFFLGPILLSPVILYYLFRRWRIKSGKSKSVIGVRTKVEALGDLLVSVVCFFGFLSVILSGSFSNIITYQYQYILFDLGQSGALYFAVGYLSSYLLLIIALGIRIIGDCLEFIKSKKPIASEAIMASGVILILTLSIRVGVDLLSYNYVLIPFILYPLALSLAVLIAFQVETSRLKIRERKLIVEGELAKGKGHETSRLEVPNNKQRTNKKNNYLGN